MKALHLQYYECYELAVAGKTVYQIGKCPLNAKRFTKEE
jgi:hypothetical protein